MIERDLDRGDWLSQRGVHEPPRDSRGIFDRGGTLMAGHLVDLERRRE